MKRKIKQKIIEIDESLEIIHNNLPNSLEEFTVLGITKDGIYKRLEFIIQNILDCFMLIYKKNKIGIPESVDDVINDLKAKKIFKNKTTNLVKSMKGLRNIIAHRYGKIDDSIVFDLLKNNLDDINLIINEIEKNNELKITSKKSKQSQKKLK